MVTVTQISRVQRRCSNSPVEPNVLHFIQPTCGAVLIKQTRKGFRWHLTMHSEAYTSFQNGQVQVIFVTNNVNTFHAGFGN